MIGKALKKLALENGMTVANGVAYGSFRGYTATLCEGSGWKRIDFSVRFSDPAQKASLLDEVGNLGDKQLNKRYRVTQFAVSEKLIQISFLDNPGTMKKMMAFLDWFVPLLDTYGASKAEFCTECGLEILEGNWILVDGVCHHVHSACGDKIQRQIEEDNQQQKEERTGSYLGGAVGAFLGAALGAVVWAVVLYLGYVASLVGLLIGWLSEKGYTLLKGKQGKGKIVILILAIIFGVLLGTLAVDAFSLGSMILAGELPGWTMGDIPVMILVMFMESPEYLQGTLGNMALGLLFAALGVIALLRKAGKEVSGRKFVKLG